MRSKAAIFIHLFLAVQLALPLYYYVGREDGNDERFAWRMFSSVRMLRCKPTFTVADSPTPLQLGGVFHEAWIRIAQRGRRHVVMAMVKHVCDRSRGAPVQVELTCVALDNQRTRYGAGSLNMCEREAM